MSPLLLEPHRWLPTALLIKYKHPPIMMCLLPHLLGPQFPPCCQCRVAIKVQILGADLASTHFLAV